jgi:hypothetical protein
MVRPKIKSKWFPTNKWWAALVTGLTTVALSAIDSGWDKTETKMAVTLLSAETLAYLTPNVPKR